jgi:branched-chain amino acid transport system ATP-binding protein
MSDLLTFDNVDAYYGRSHVLHAVSLTVDRGGVVLLLGRNGAGKTTVMRTIMGLVTVRGGDIRLRGERILGLAAHQIAQLGIGLVPEDRRVFAKLTVRENLELGRKPPIEGTQRSAWDFDAIFALFPALAELQERRAGTLSGGQQQMLTIARTLMGNPELLLLDEPAEGLAPVIVDALAERLATLRQQGLSMLISEQNLTFARALADRAYVMESGKVRHHGTIAQLDANPSEWTQYVAF